MHKQCLSNKVPYHNVHAPHHVSILLFPHDVKNWCIFRMGGGGECIVTAYYLNVSRGGGGGGQLCQEGANASALPPPPQCIPVHNNYTRTFICYANVCLF